MRPTRWWKPGLTRSALNLPSTRPSVWPWWKRLKPGLRSMPIRGLESINRALHQFGDRWRKAGHVGEKSYELQPLWEASHWGWQPSCSKRHRPRARVCRQAMIEEAVALGADPVLRIDAIKVLQQRWQAEAHVVPLDRRQEQKLWDAFRKPIDEAFNRKTAGA